MARPSLGSIALGAIETPRFRVIVSMLRPLLGQRVELIALQTEPIEPPRKRITLDEFLTHRLTAPPGVRLSLEDMTCCGGPA